MITYTTEQGTEQVLDILNNNTYTTAQGTDEILSEPLPVGIQEGLNKPHYVSTANKVQLNVKMNRADKLKFRLLKERLYPSGITNSSFIMYLVDCCIIDNIPTDLRRKGD